MSARSILVAGLALITGLSAAYAVQKLRASAPAVTPGQVETVPVVVAEVSVGRGTTLSKEVLSVREWPKSHVPPGAIEKIEDVLDRAVVGSLLAGEPVLEGKLAPLDGGRGMAALVGSGMRAFTIHTPTLASGVAGFILPGNRVDVLLTITKGNANDASGGGSTATLMQNIEILAVDQRLEAPAENMVSPEALRSVTLLVTPAQAAKLGLAQTQGTLQLSLRNDGDQLAANTRPVTLNELRFGEEKPTRFVDSLVAGFAKMAEAAAKAKPAKPAEPIAKAPEPAAPKPITLRVRTLRGVQAGQVLMQQMLPAAVPEVAERSADRPATASQ